MNTALEKVISGINKALGDNVIVRGNEADTCGVISTGITSLDYITGHGGVPRKRITEIWGNKSTGKTTLCLNIAKECQKQGGQVVFVDVEQTFDKDWAEYIGVNVEELILIKPSTAEEALEVTYQMIQPEVDLIIFDSIAALPPIQEIEKKIGEPTVGLTAKLMNVAMRKYVGPIRKNDIAMVFVNQVRDDIGAFSPFGKPETTPGGRAIAFHASLRISLRAGKSIKLGTEQIGNLVTARIEKNKMGRPQRTTTYPFYYNCDQKEKFCEDCKQVYCPRKEGSFDLLDNLFTTAKFTRVIEQAGPTYLYGEYKWKGQDAAKDAIRANPELAQLIRDDVIKSCADE